MKKVHGFTIMELVLAISLLAFVVAVFSGSYVRSLWENKNNDENVHELDIRCDLISFIDLSEFSDVRAFVDSQLYVVEEYDSEGVFVRKFSTDVADMSDCKYLVECSVDSETDAFLQIECEILEKSAEKLVVVDTFKTAKLR